jgi:hypothetical protein
MSIAARRLHSLAPTLVALPSISAIPFLDSWFESLAVASHPLQPDYSLLSGISNSHAGGNQMSAIARIVVA